jgi:hypothetical protein
MAPATARWARCQAQVRSPVRASSTHRLLGGDAQQRACSAEACVRAGGPQHAPAVAAVPYIKLSKERNRRLGFFEWEQFVALRKQLPDYLKPVMTVAYFTGWRVPSELLTRKRTHVTGGMLVLEAYEGKNEQPRKFPLDMIPELKETIERQLGDDAEARSRE